MHEMHRGTTKWMVEGEIPTCRLQMAQLSAQFRSRGHEINQQELEHLGNCNFLYDRA